MVPFQSKAEHAIPSEALTEVIDKLKNDPKTHVAIISGRDKNFLEEYFGNTNFHLAAEYGAKIRAPGKEWVQPQKFDVEWMENVKQKMDDCENCLISVVYDCPTYSFFNLCSYPIARARE